jgi:hypothetical protein
MHTGADEFPGRENPPHQAVTGLASAGTATTTPFLSVFICVHPWLKRIVLD